jgi:hypothetical protein
MNVHKSDLTQNQGYVILERCMCWIIMVYVYINNYKTAMKAIVDNWWKDRI